MKKILSLALAAAMTLSLLAGCGSKDSGSSTSSANSGGASSQTTGTHDPVTINFPTASASGALYAVGAAITNLWDTEIDYVSASSQASAGGIENLTLVSEGEAQVSIAISSNCYQCLNGTDSFEGYAYDDLKLIAGLYFNPNQVVVTEKSGITSLADVARSFLDTTSTQGFPVSETVRIRFRSSGVRRTVPSTIRRMSSACSMACRERSTPIRSMGSSVSRRPAVSMRRRVTLPSSTRSSTVSLVVPGISVTMARSYPASAFNREDLPALGRPTMAQGIPSRR